MANARDLSKIGRVCFHAFGTSTQSWSSGSTQTNIVQLTSQTSMPTKVSGFSTSTYRFTVPADGLYMFTGKITQTTTTTGPQAILFKNGVSFHELAIVYGVGFFSSSGTAVLPLVAGDIIDMRVTNANGVAVTLDTSRCSFTGVLIG